MAAWRPSSARGHACRPVWSAAPRVGPAAIEDVHRLTSRPVRPSRRPPVPGPVVGFEAAVFDRAAALDAIRRSAELAQQARDGHAAGPGHTGPLLVPVVRPYARFCDVSEYAATRPGDAVLREVHSPRIDPAGAEVDVLALETIPTIREAEVLVGWSRRPVRRRGCRTSAGTGIRRRWRAHPRRGLVTSGYGDRGVGSTAPRHGTCRRCSLLPRLPTDRPRIAYPNGGDRWDASAIAGRHRRCGSIRRGRGRVVDGPRATWVGGCCGTRPRTSPRLPP